MDRRTVYQSVPVLEWRSTDEIACAVAARVGCDPDERNFIATIRRHLWLMKKRGEIAQTFPRQPDHRWPMAYWRRKP